MAFRGVALFWSVVSQSALAIWMLGKGRGAPEVLGNSEGTHQNAADSNAGYPNLGVAPDSVAPRGFPRSRFVWVGSFVFRRLSQLGVGEGRRRAPKILEN